MKFIWQCMFSPRLYKIYRDGARDNYYQAQTLEKWGDKIIVVASTIYNVGFYASPFICIYMYRQGMFSLGGSGPMLQFIGSIGCLLAISFFMRGLGRAMDPKYVSFLEVYNTPKTNAKVYLDQIRKYDFDFAAWPVTYNVSKENAPYFFKFKNPFTSVANNDLPTYRRYIIQTLAFAATHSFVLKLVYPGSVGLIHSLLWMPLLQGRTLLVENYKGSRTKIGTVDGNEIDTMFVDNRTGSKKGHTLVICSEGNSGFYEIGIITTPLKCGYSALGWNHPGFAGSTGTPYPDQEQNAMDAVMQYAINELGFAPENIVLFGWSIGGYTSSWAAVNYPVKALVLDATFDDLLPLAQNQMPNSWKLLVKEVIRTHVDLNIADYVTKYKGPVQLVRRTEDEIICLRPGQLASNCGNFLLLKLIHSRHSDELEQLQNSNSSLVNYVTLLDSQRDTILKNKKDHNDTILLTLISKYMRDYKSSHCTPLPAEVFQNIMDSLEERIASN